MPSKPWGRRACHGDHNFNQPRVQPGCRPSKKRPGAAKNGPAFITDRGKLACVLLSFEEYHRMTGRRGNIVEALSMPGLSDIDVDFPRLRELARPADSE